MALGDTDISTDDGTIDPKGGGLNAAGWGTLGLGALALGGLGYMASGGPTQVSSIPGFAQANAQVPGLLTQSNTTYGQGQALVGQAATAYDMAQRGQLTPEQSAQLALTKQGLENTARQTYASMGRDMGRDTSGISTEANIDAQTTAMAQEYIKSTIALATSEMQAGNSLMGTSLQEASAATNILMTEGQQQIALNKQYSDSLSSAFGSVAKIFGAVAPTLLKAALV